MYGVRSSSIYEGACVILLITPIVSDTPQPYWAPIAELTVKSLDWLMNHWPNRITIDPYKRQRNILRETD